MKLHERTLHVRAAAGRATTAFWDSVTADDLTLIETAIVANEIAQTALRYALRTERHGDPGHKADEA